VLSSCTQKVIGDSTSKGQGADDAAFGTLDSTGQIIEPNRGKFHKESRQVGV